MGAKAEPSRGASWHAGKLTRGSIDREGMGSGRTLDPCAPKIGLPKPFRCARQKVRPDPVFGLPPCQRQTSLHKQVMSYLRLLFAGSTLVTFFCVRLAAQGLDFAETKELANMGNPVGQNNLGVMYESGNGAAQDSVEAAKWYRKSADQGYAIGQSNLGFMYESGSGVPQDFAEAAKWYRKAADQGSANAQLKLGLMYAEGRGVSKNDNEAVKWFRKASDQGLAGAQNNLGVMHKNGFGIAIDYAEAAKCYRKAADQGAAEAQSNLGFMYANGLGVPLDYAEAVNWWRKSANQGYAEAQTSIGVMYAYGRGVPQDEAEAFAWINLAGISDKNVAAMRDLLEKRLTPEIKARAKQRLTELQKEIEARMTARKDIDGKKSRK